MKPGWYHKGKISITEKLGCCNEGFFNLSLNKERGWGWRTIHIGKTPRDEGFMPQ
jgi:hypothetical protein